MESEKVIGSVRRWLDSIVVAMNLCPFAGRELENDRVRFVVTDAISEERLLVALEAELKLLNNDTALETTLLIHPDVLQEFPDYNQFLQLADELLVQMNLEGIYQIASFHPDYQFSGTDQDAAENYTNRSPWPLLHLIREESLERAIAEYPDVKEIPQRNILRMNEVGRKQLQALLHACFQ